MGAETNVNDPFKFKSLFIPFGYRLWGSTLMYPPTCMCLFGFGHSCVNRHVSAYDWGGMLVGTFEDLCNPPEQGGSKTVSVDMQIALSSLGGLTNRVVHFLRLRLRADASLETRARTGLNVALLRALLHRVRNKSVSKAFPASVQTIPCAILKSDCGGLHFFSCEILI